VLEERKSERVGPALRLSVKVVWGRRGPGGGEMVARHRTDEFGYIDSLDGCIEVAWVCAISVRHFDRLRMVSRVGESVD